MFAHLTLLHLAFFAVGDLYRVRPARPGPICLFYLFAVTARASQGKGLRGKDPSLLVLPFELFSRWMFCALCYPLTSHVPRWGTPKHRF